VEKKMNSKDYANDEHYQSLMRELDVLIAEHRGFKEASKNSIGIKEFDKVSAMEDFCNKDELQFLQKLFDSNNLRERIENRMNTISSKIRLRENIKNQNNVGSYKSK
jgi:hypothetical protein